MGMIKRCVYLLAEYIFESTLKLKLPPKNNKIITQKLMDNYIHIKLSIIKHLSNESQHLASEIEAASNILFSPTDILYDLLCTQNEPIPAIQSNHDSDINDLNLFESIKTMMSNTTNDNNEQPRFYKKYTLFEMKVVEFYHSSNVVLCFQTLLCQLMEHQIKLNRSSKIQIKPKKKTFFEAFNFSNYTKPQQQQKLTMKERLISKIMQSKSIDQETQKKITNLYRTKKTVDMKQEQQDSISDAIIKRQEWEQQQKELTKQQSLFNNNKIKEQELQKNNN